MEDNQGIPNGLLSALQELCVMGLWQSVRLLSSDITNVATFTGFRAWMNSSTSDMSNSVKVPISFSLFLTSGKAVQLWLLAAAEGNIQWYHMHCSILLQAQTVNQHTVTSLCLGSTSNFCFSCKAWSPVAPLGKTQRHIVLIWVLLQHLAALVCAVRPGGGCAHSTRHGKSQLNGRWHPY